MQTRITQSGTRPERMANHLGNSDRVGAGQGGGTNGTAFGGR